MVASPVSKWPQPLPPQVTEGKKRSSHTINCLAKSALTRQLPATALSPIEFPEVKEVKEHLLRAD